MSEHCPTCGQQIPERYENAAPCGIVTHVGDLDGISIPEEPEIGSANWYCDHFGIPRNDPYNRRCCVCAGELPSYANWWYDGRPLVHMGRWFCSNKCRQKAYRARKGAA
jgi:predicted nucleic acid-binding Zn ribbon protein